MICFTLVKVLLFIDLLIKTDIWAFKCRVGDEIPDSLYCNGEVDCFDGSDEGYGCTGFFCGPGKFTCRTGDACLDIKVRCDGIIGCQDKSDEQQCDENVRKKFESQNCTLYHGKFPCKNKLACLDVFDVCDGRCNCLDCSDENHQNCADRLCKDCTKHCLSTPDGPRCICNSVNHQNTPLCEGILNCSESSMCAQGCYLFQNREYCSCYPGYHSVPSSGGRRCRKNDWYSSVFIYSTASKIKYVNLTTNETFTLVKDVHCTALAAARDYVYYATKIPQKPLENYIFRAAIDSELTKGEKLIQWDSPVTSIAVDYITTNVYFIANESLIICTSEGQHCTKIKGSVTKIILAPSFGLMFYTEKRLFFDRLEETYYLMKSNMDGSGENLFADDVFESPDIPLVVDESAKQVLYVTFLRHRDFASSYRLDFMSFDEKFKQLRRGSHWGTVSNLAVFDHEVFFKMFKDEKIYYIENFTDLDPAPMVYFSDNSSRTLNNFYVHNPRLPRDKDSPCDTASCPGLCLLRPISAENPRLTYTCSTENTHSLAEYSAINETFKSTEHPQSHNYFNVWVFLLVALAVFGFGGYFAFQKRHLYDYYKTLRVWRWNKGNIRREVVEDLE